jgi:hypothetical protein
MDKIENLNFTEACKLAHLGWLIKRDRSWVAGNMAINEADTEATDWVAIDTGRAVG